MKHAVRTDLNPFDLRLRRGQTSDPSTLSTSTCVKRELGANDQHEFDLRMDGESLVGLRVVREKDTLELIQRGLGSHKVPTEASFAVLLGGTLQTFENLGQKGEATSRGLVDTYRAQLSVGRATSLEIYFHGQQIGDFTL